MDNVIEENIFQLQAVEYNQLFEADHLGNSTEHTCKFTYCLSHILRFLNVLQNGEMCIHLCWLSENKRKPCIMAT